MEANKTSYVIEQKAYYVFDGYDKTNLVNNLMDIMSFEGLKELVDNYEEVNGEIKLK